MDSTFLAQARISSLLLVNLFQRINSNRDLSLAEEERDRKFELIVFSRVNLIPSVSSFFFFFLFFLLEAKLFIFAPAISFCKIKAL